MKRSALLKARGTSVPKMANGDTFRPPRSGFVVPRKSSGTEGSERPSTPHVIVTPSKPSPRAQSSPAMTTTPSTAPRPSTATPASPAVTPSTKRHSFAVPRKSGFAAPKRLANATPESEADNSPTAVFSVLYTKYSQKKHRTWLDGVVVITPRVVYLKDMEGKLVSKEASKNFRVKVGETFAVCWWDVEVMNTIPLEEYTSGRVFLTSLAQQSSGPAKVTVSFAAKKKMRPVSRPDMPDDAVGKRQKVAATPRHDPSAPGAVILYEPMATEEVHIVVDPVIGQHLRPHQIEGVKFLWRNVMGIQPAGDDVALQDSFRGVILADEMGLGKTLQSITLLWTLLKQGVHGKPTIQKAVIVCPSSLVGGWKAEFKKWLGVERCRTVTVDVTGKDAETRVRDFALSASVVAPVLIISYEMLRKYVGLLDKAGVGLLICDEGHRLKNSCGNKTINALTSMSTRRRVILTGTPVQNDLEEFYAVVNFVNPGVLGTRTGFKRVFQQPIERSRDKSASKEELDLGQERSTELARLTGMFILRRTSAILTEYLPEKNEIELFCRLSQAQEARYKDLLSVGLVGDSYGAASLVLLGKLRRLCDHVNLCESVGEDDEEESETDQTREHVSEEGSSEHKESPIVSDLEKGSSKLMILSRLLNQVRSNSKDKFVIVSIYTGFLKVVEEWCKAAGHPYLMLIGSTDITKRADIVRKFNDPSSPEYVLLLSSRAGGTGFNLVGANRLVLMDSDWNPAVDRQAMARIWRDGQKKKTFIYRMVATGTVEEKIFLRQVLKQEVADSVVDNKGKVERRLSKEDLKELFEYDEEVEECLTREMLCPQSSIARRRRKQSLLGSVVDSAAFDETWSVSDWRGAAKAADPMLAVSIDTAETSGAVTSYVHMRRINVGKIM